MKKEVNIKEIWKIIKRNFPVLIFSVVIFGFSSFLYAKFSKPIYRAIGKIYMGPSKIEIKSLNDFILADYGERVIKTQIELLKSAQVLKIAAEKLNINQKLDSEGVDFLKEHISISAVEGTYIIEVSAEHNSPQLARDMVNAMMKGYLDFQKSAFSSDISNTLNSIMERLIEVKERLKKSEENLLDFVKKNNVKETDGEEKGSFLSMIKNLLVERKTELISLRARYGNKHPLVLQKESEIRDMERLFDKEREKAIEEQEKAIRFSMLQKDVEAEKEIYNTLLKEMKKIDTLGNIRDMDIKLIEEAKLPLHPIKPKPLRSSLFGVFVGFMIGIIAVFILENIDSTIKRESEIEEDYDIPILASIPYIKFQKFSEILNGEHLNYEKLYSILTLAGFISHEPKTFLVVSSQEDEGKTFVSLLFSASLARGNKVLLQELDFKRQKLKKILNVGRDDGLSNYLLGRSAIKDVIFETEIKNLYFLPSGNNPPISPSLLLKKGFQKLYEELRGIYDYIIIDTPPLLFYSHPLEMVGVADFILLVVRANHTTKQDLKKTISLLKGVKAKAMGIVFNYAEERRYYYKYYYSS